MSGEQSETNREPSELPRLDRLVIAVLLRGRGAEFVVGDLVERFDSDLADADMRRGAHRRLRRGVLASALAWWRPSAVAARRGAGNAGTAEGGARCATPHDHGDGRGEMLGTWIQDLRIAARSLVRRPGFSAGVALTLGLGIGATTTIFSVVDGVLLRSLPYAEPDAIVAVGTTFPTREWDDEEAGLQHLAGISMRNFMDYRERTRSFEALAGAEVTNVLLPDVGTGPELAAAAMVSTEFFEILGVTPALGRLFLPDEHEYGAAGVFLISWGAWQRRYASDPDVIGRGMSGSDAGGVIVGVLPRDFDPPEHLFSVAPEFWMPLQPDNPRYADRGRRSLGLVGRLAEGVTPLQARAEARGIATALATEYPEGNVYPDGSYFGIGVNDLHAQTVGTSGRTLRIFLGAAAMLLLLASMNAATLLLARALDRVQELGVRMALGAGRGRVVRLLMSEACLLTIAGGVIGVGFAYAGVWAFLQYAPASIPRMTTVAVDGRVLALAAAVSLGAGIAAGLVPAMRLSRGAAWSRAAASARSSSEPTSRLRSSLVGGQVAVAVVLLSGAGLLFTSFVRIVSVEPGFEPDGLISLNVGLKRPGAEEEPAWQGWDLVLAEVSGIPGVESVAGTSNPPFQDPFWAPRLLLPGDSPETRREGIAGFSVTPGYLETIGTRLVSGRGIERLDGPDAEAVALVNETFVRTQLGGAEAIDVIVTQSEGGVDTPIRIVGIVEDVVQRSADQGPQAAIYVPYTQSEWPFVQVVVRTSLAAETIIPELRTAIARFNPIVSPRDVRTMRDRMSASRTNPRFQAMLIGAFAVIALLLASAGLYGSLSHAVGRRKREMGVRMALGAERRGVLGLVVREGLKVALGGLALGLIGTFWATRVLTDFLFGVEPNDPLTLAGVALVLGTVSLLACLLPARRATAVDPVEVLRAE